MSISFRTSNFKIFPRSMLRPPSPPPPPNALSKLIPNLNMLEPDSIVCNSPPQEKSWLEPVLCCAMHSLDYVNCAKLCVVFIIFCGDMLCCVVHNRGLLCCTKLCFAMLSYVMSCHVILCNVVLCYDLICFLSQFP